GDKDWFTGDALAAFTDELAARASTGSPDLDAARSAGAALYRYALAMERHDQAAAARFEADVRRLVPDVIANAEAPGATLADARVTVSDVLAAEARLQLARRGFDVVPAETVEGGTRGRAPGSARAAGELAKQAELPGLALYLEIRRWDPDAPTHPAFVLVGLAASLVDPASGRVLWSADHPVRPVPTPGEVAVGPAYVTAARKVMEELLAPLG